MEFHNCIYSKAVLGFRGGSDSKESVCNAGDLGLILLWEKSPGEGNGNLRQYSYLKNPHGRGVQRAIAHGVTNSQTCLGD